MKNPKEIFAEKLNYYMDLNGKDQIDLINELGINKSTISTWCRGEKMPRMGTIQTLADYFGIMKSDLIEEKPPTEVEGSLKAEILRIVDQLPEDKIPQATKILQVLIDEDNKSSK